MVGQIGPLVQVGRKKTALAFHVLGGIVGGAAIGVVLGFAGLLLRAALGESLDTVFLVVVPAALLYAAAVDLGLLRVRSITWERQTPGDWPCSLGHYPGIFAWGFDLGLGITTRIPYQTVLVLPLAALLAGDLATAVAITTVYGSLAGARRRRSGFHGRRRLRSRLRRDPEPSPAFEASRRRDRSCNRSPDRDFLTQGGGEEMQGAIYILSRKVIGDHGESLMQNVTVSSPAPRTMRRSIVADQFARLRRPPGRRRSAYQVQPCVRHREGRPRRAQDDHRRGHRLAMDLTGKTAHALARRSSRRQFFKFLGAGSLGAGLWLTRTDVSLGAVSGCVGCGGGPCNPCFSPVICRPVSPAEPCKTLPAGGGCPDGCNTGGEWFCCTDGDPAAGSAARSATARRVRRTRRAIASRTSTSRARRGCTRTTSPACVRRSRRPSDAT